MLHAHIGGWKSYDCVSRLEQTATHTNEQISTTSSSSAGVNKKENSFSIFQEDFPQSTIELEIFFLATIRFKF